MAGSAVMANLGAESAVVALAAARVLASIIARWEHDRSIHNGGHAAGFHPGACRLVSGTHTTPSALSSSKVACEIRKRWATASLTVPPIA